MRAREGEHLLRAFRFKQSFKAGDGKDGLGKNKTGHRGDSLVVNVPVGTVLWRVGKSDDKELLGELIEDNTTLLVARGGKGGKGNIHFASPENRTPLLAEGGELGKEIALDLELKLLADVGIVGLPSVGKSSFLRVCSRARPDVAEYPFTTLEPVLGWVERKGREFICVEIPGLIEGAHEGVGLGHEFLRHLGRTKATIHLLDGASGDVMKEYHQVKEEIRLYDDSLLERPEIIAVNKIDLPEVRDRISTIRETLERNGTHGLFISALTGEGMDEVLDVVSDMVETQRGVEVVQSKDVPILYPEPRAERPSVERNGDVFVLKSSRAERLIRRVDLEDGRVQLQLWHEFQRMGVAQALKRAGAKSGAVVRIGESELEWK